MFTKRLKNSLPVLLLLAAFCAQLPQEKGWNNPFDPYGTNYYPPVVSPKTDTLIKINDKISLSAQGSDENGTIKWYRWSFNGGATWDTVPADLPFDKSWSVSETGKNTVWFSSIDNDGLVSSPDSFIVSVHSYTPVLTKIQDTIVSQLATVNISMQVSDTVGNIIRYFMKTDTGSVWSDSSDSPAFSFSHPEGGALKVIWAAMDDDNNCVYDSFNISFNRGPDTADFTTTPEFLTFDFDRDAGTYRVNFSAEDPDGDADIQSYSLFLGADNATPAPVYSGSETSLILDSIAPGTSYTWILRVKDLFGDSIETTGKFTSPGHPSGPEGMKFVKSKNLNFNMGQDGFALSETPVHMVSFTYHYWIDSTEVTTEDFSELTGSPLIANGNLPVSNISWADAAYYCNQRSKRDSLDTVYIYTAISGTPGANCSMEGLMIDIEADGYRLPTEAEWEYACRARKVTTFYWGNSLLESTAYAWLKTNSLNTAQPVAQKKPNAFGLYDMAGNLWEWCNDWYDSSYYSASPSTDPSGPQSGQERVIRGGSWMHSEYFAQSGTRSKMPPSSVNSTVGFRVVLRVR